MHIVIIQKNKNQSGNGLKDGMRFSNCSSAEAIDSSLLFIKAEKHSRRACISSEADLALTSASHAAFPTTAANSSISKGSLGVNKGGKKMKRLRKKEKKVR